MLLWQCQLLFTSVISLRNCFGSPFTLLLLQSFSSTGLLINPFLQRDFPNTQAFWCFWRRLSAFRHQFYCGCLEFFGIHFWFCLSLDYTFFSVEYFNKCVLISVYRSFCRCPVLGKLVLGFCRPFRCYRRHSEPWKSLKVEMGFPAIFSQSIFLIQTFKSSKTDVQDC